MYVYIYSFAYDVLSKTTTIINNTVLYTHTLIAYDRQHTFGCNKATTSWQSMHLYQIHTSEAETSRTKKKTEGKKCVCCGKRLLFELEHILTYEYIKFS